MAVVHDFLVSPKFYLMIYCAVYCIVLYCTDIHRESIVLGYSGLKEVHSFTVTARNIFSYYFIHYVRVTVNHRF